ncbi:MAG: hypothetical protein R6V44_12820 [Paracoccaceae bacterium]
MRAAGEQLRKDTLEPLRRHAKRLAACKSLDRRRRGHPRLAGPTVQRALAASRARRGVHRLEALNAFVACRGDQPDPVAILADRDDCGAAEEHASREAIGTPAPLKGRVALRALTRDDVAYPPRRSDMDRGFPISVVDLLAMGLRREIGPLGRPRRRVAAAISAPGLTGFDCRPIGSPPGDRMRRALFARRLLEEARLMLLDEPSARSTPVPWQTFSASCADAALVPLCRVASRAVLTLALPLAKGRCATLTRDCRRHGTTPPWPRTAFSTARRRGATCRPSVKIAIRPLRGGQSTLYQPISRCAPVSS